MQNPPVQVAKLFTIEFIERRLLIVLLAVLLPELQLSVAYSAIPELTPMVKNIPGACFK